MILFNSTIQDVLDEWKMGDVFFGTTTYASITYTLKYMCKESLVGRFKRDDRLKEYRNMSQGLGYNYLTAAMINWHREDVTRLYSVVDGKKVSLPRYYRDRIYCKEDLEAARELLKDEWEEIIYSPDQVETLMKNMYNNSKKRL